MIWSPSIAKKLAEAVPPFEHAPRDWDDVLAREAKNRRGAGRLGTALSWPRRRALLAAVPVVVIGLWLSLILAFAPALSSGAGGPPPQEIWTAIAASPSFSENAGILAARGEFSKSEGDPYGELTVTLRIRTATGPLAHDPDLLSPQGASWLGLMAAATYENEALKAGRSGLRVITTRIESESPDGTTVSSTSSDSVAVPGAAHPIVAPVDLAGARAGVLTKADRLPNVRSLDVSVLRYGHSAAAKVSVVANDPDDFSSTYPRLSKILSDEFANGLIGTRFEVYDLKGDLVLDLSSSPLLRERSVLGFRPWVGQLAAQTNAYPG